MLGVKLVSAFMDYFLSQLVDQLLKRKPLAYSVTKYISCIIHPFLLFKFSEITDEFCGLSLWPWIYSVGSHFALLSMYSRNLLLEEMIVLMECKPEIGVPAISLASVSYQLVPVSTWVSHGWLAAQKCLWIYVLWFNILIPFINEILLYSIVWNSVNQSFSQNSEYRKVCGPSYIIIIIITVQNDM